MINMELLNRVNQAIRTLEDVKKELEEVLLHPTAMPKAQETKPEPKAPELVLPDPVIIPAAPDPVLDVPVLEMPEPLTMPMPGKEAALKAETAVPAEQTTCPACGRQIRAGSRFCMNCGAQIQAAAPKTEQEPPKSRFCMSCGSPLKPTDRFCMKCGTKA